MLSKLSLLHHRLKQFADHIIEEELRLYKDEDITIPYRWHSILQILSSSKSSLTITQLAEVQNKTHPDVVFTINQMMKAGLVEDTSNIQDKRKRSIQATTKGLALIKNLKPLWQASKIASEKWLQEIAPELDLNLDALNQSLETESLYHRIKQVRKTSETQYIDIHPDEDITEANHKLQLQLLEFQSNYFKVPHIEEASNQLNELKQKSFGKLQFATWKNQEAGAVLLTRKSFDLAEIVFLWIHDDFRRKYIGSSLLNAALNLAIEIGTKEIMIQTHPKLVALNALLRKSGFQAEERKNILCLEPLQITMFKSLR